MSISTTLNHNSLPATVPVPANVAAVLATASNRIRRKFEANSQAIVAIGKAPHGKKAKTARLWARRVGRKSKTLINLRSLYVQRGAIALVDRRAFANARNSRSRLPADFIRFLGTLSSKERLTRHEVYRLLADRLVRWRDGDDAAAIPGYLTPPDGNPPHGWSPKNLTRHLPAIRRSKVVVELRSDGSTRIVKGKLARIPRHPLFNALRAQKEDRNV
jgi:hypothetical protein